jgi:4a-hydroxytetrahydrobiopterin dehydratase
MNDNIPNWTEKEKKLTSEFEFSNFTEALDFVNKIGKKAEDLQHHPDILMHDYKHVTIMLFTHDEDAITKKDHELAKLIDDMYSEFN